MKPCVCVLFFAATSVLACFGQAPTNSALPVTRVSTAPAAGGPWSAPGRNEFSMWGGFSPNSPTFIGASEQRTLSTMGLRYARLLTATRLAALKYTFDVIPLALIRQPVSHGTWEDRQHRETRYGAGLAPIGLQLNFRSRSRLQPFAEGNGGFLYFTRPTPYTTTSKFNFTFSLGAGFQTFTSSHRAVTFGYKYHHLSNAYLAPVNPGMDSNVFYLGYSLFR